MVSYELDTWPPMAGIMIRGYRFEEPVSKDGLLMALEAIDLEDVEVEETAGGLDFVAQTVWDLPPQLWVDGVEVCLMQQTAGAPGEQPVAVWFSPPFPVDLALACAPTWQEKLDGLGLLKQQDGFMESFVEIGAEHAQAGARFASLQQAQAFISKWRGKVTISLPGARKGQAYSMALDPVDATETTSTPSREMSTCSSATSLGNMSAGSYFLVPPAGTSTGTPKLLAKRFQGQHIRSGASLLQLVSAVADLVSATGG